MDFKALREKAGLKLEQLAEMANYSVSTINGLELHDEGSPRLRKKLAEILISQGPAPTVLRDAIPGHVVDDCLAEVLEIRERVGALEMKLRKLKK